MTDVPGTVIAHRPADSRTYIGSPAIAVTDDGEYLASHDLFGPGSGFDTSVVYGSTDRGVTWERRATVRGQFWSSLFCAHGQVWMLGTNRKFGDVVLRRSADGGRTWTTPSDVSNGLLRSGNFHTAPTPVVAHAGRWWRAIEDVTDTAVWGRSFRAGVLSAPVGADLLDGRNWTHTEFAAVDPSWLAGTMNAWLEGNAVVDPSGEVVDMLRVDVPGDAGIYSAQLRVTDPAGALAVDPRASLVEMPGGISKFTVRWDARSASYHALVNHVPAGRAAHNGMRGRHVLCHAFSSDLRHWEVGRELLVHEDDLHHGFQYVDWTVDGDDIIFVSRTAFDDDAGGAANFHDSNFLTFHRFERFRVPAAGPEPGHGAAHE